MSEAKEEIARRFFSGNASSYDQVVNLLTLGVDRYWKREILRRCPARANRVLDLACGTGILTFLLAQRYPEAEIIGIDLMPDYLEIARRKAAEDKVHNVTFIHSRAEEVNLEGPFDCITASYLAKYADLDLLVRKMASLLWPGGILVLHDFTYPTNPAVAWLLERYFQLLQLLGPLRFPEWRHVFFELPAFLRRAHWVADLVKAMEGYGLAQVRVERFSFGTAAIVNCAHLSP